MKEEFSYEILEEVAVLSENARGWRKELNLISWNGRPPKFDLREWALITKMGNHLNQRRIC